MNFYTLGPKATIAVVPKFGIKLVKNEVIQLPDGRYMKNKVFKDLVSGGSLRKLSKTEAQELIGKGFKDVTNGRRSKEVNGVEETEEEKTLKIKEAAAKEAERLAAEEKSKTFGAWLAKADKTTILKWLEDADEELIPSQKYDEASAIDKVAPLRTFVAEVVGAEFMDSKFVTE